MKQYSPRPNQLDILSYTSGKMGVSAVPGSGKTWTLSMLAADIIARGDLDDGQEVLVVTLVNSAVDNFTHRVSTFLQARQQIPHLGFRVRTLHGLAHDIVRERPDIVGLDNNFLIIDERAANQIRDQVALAWLQSNPGRLKSYLDSDLKEGRLEWINRKLLPDLVKDISFSFIRSAKDMQLTPEQLSYKLNNLQLPLPLAEMGAEIYEVYQRALAFRGAVDFDDLIRLALKVLQIDEELLHHLRDRWPYILEDEAQDSTKLQENILRLLTGDDGNWVRVGDPNQAIYETFTTASPDHLRNFKNEANYWKTLPSSGRSTKSIFSIANHLIDWTRFGHPREEVRDALTTPHIKPLSENQEGSNPPDEPDKIHIILTKFSPQEELNAIADSLSRWLPEHPDETVAVLVPRNTRGFQLTDILNQRSIEYIEILQSTASTRSTAGSLGNILAYLADPQSPSKLATVYRVWRREDRDEPQVWNQVQETARKLRSCRFVEDFIWPRIGHNWFDYRGIADEDPNLKEELSTFRDSIRRWQGAVSLPVDQTLLTLGQDLFKRPDELATTHKLAVLLRRTSDLHPEWRLMELVEELGVIARNERRFLGFADDDTAFDPEKYKGKVVVATVHKAKGLEWDRVYLMSVNNYDFPSGSDYDQYLPEKWYVRDNLNLVAEALAQLKTPFMPQEYVWYTEGRPTEEARLDYIRERLRLLYVGITRARKQLVITWNTGRNGDLNPALPLLELHSYWEKKQ